MTDVINECDDATLDCLRPSELRRFTAAECGLLTASTLHKRSS